MSVWIDIKDKRPENGQRVLAFLPGNSLLNIKNPIFRIICFNLFMMLMTFVITIPISVYFVSMPFIYYLAESLIITPLIIYRIPYFRNLLDDYSEKL